MEISVQFFLYTNVLPRYQTNLAKSTIGLTKGEWKNTFITKHNLNTKNIQEALPFQLTSGKQNFALDTAQEDFLKKVMLFFLSFFGGAGV